MTYYICNSNELYHYGILGQKWGVRRYQNPDGTLTEAGKKRYAKNLYNDVKSLKLKWTSSINLAESHSVGKKIESQIDKNELNKLKDENKKWQKLRIEAEKASYWNSKERENADAKAYNDVINWYKKNDPDEFKRMLSQTDDLLWFHDFRKMYEGYQDHYWTIGEKDYYKKHPDALVKQKEADEAYDLYHTHSKKMAQEITQIYGSKKLSTIQNSHNSLNDVVESYINDLSYDWERLKQR